MIKTPLLILSLLVAAGTASRADDKDGFKPLFNGRDWSGWYIISGRGSQNKLQEHKWFTIHDGMVHMYQNAPEGSSQPFGYFCTEKEFSNYHLRFQYKWGTKKFAPKLDANRDAGLLFHAHGKDGVWPDSVECQIQETDTGDIFTVRTRVETYADPKTTNVVVNVVTNQQTKVVSTNHNFRPRFLAKEEGGVKVVQGDESGVKRVHRGSNREVDGWNTVEVIARGDSAVYVINGHTNNLVTKMEHKVGDKWEPLTKGKILLQQEGAEVFYRNIEIKMLDEK
jgi:hypothetical protein